MENQNEYVPVEKVGLLLKIKNWFAEVVDMASAQWRIQPLLPREVVAGSFFSRISNIGRQVCVAHNPSHALEFIYDMLALSGSVKGSGCFVEAGCFKGGSAAKFSVVAKMLGRDLVLFDSFEGLPDNDENHTVSLKGHSIEGWFDKGKFSGTLDEVRSNISAHGEISVCKFVEGWFDETMPAFSEPILAAYLDVDLASSTRTCLKYLYPLLVPGGVICSQDGDFPLVLEVFQDRAFWQDELGVAPPPIEGLGKKIIRIRKPLS